VPTTVELLEQLLRCAETRADASAILHERVVLERLDGEVLRGRTTVVDAMVTRDSGSALKVVAREDHESLRVALVVEPRRRRAAHRHRQDLPRDARHRLPQARDARRRADAGPREPVVRRPLRRVR
jgi:hypothetical protein